MTATIDLARALISRRSVTPADAGCQTLIADRLTALGFNNQHLRFDDVDNLWSTHGDSGPLLVFAGHTDVVPPGNEADWRHPPFDATVDDGMLHGRGAADMKSSIAAMVVACERVLAANGDQPLPARLGFLITSDEEGPAVNGTRRVIEYLNERDCKIDSCIVGEPTSVSALGDTIKVGRRGSLNGHLIVHGVQGHVAYAHLAENPVHTIAPVLNELSAYQWDNGNQHFPPTTFQISNIDAGTGADNVIPASLELKFNFRYSTEVTAEQLKEIVVSMIDRHQVKYDLSWRLSGEPFMTGIGELAQIATRAIKKVTGIDAELSTSGGTSDGRFIAPTGAQVIELGPINATIHQVDERVTCDELEALTDIYSEIIATHLALPQPS